MSKINSEQVEVLNQFVAFIKECGESYVSSLILSGINKIISGNTDALVISTGNNSIQFSYESIADSIRQHVRYNLTLNKKTLRVLNKFILIWLGN